MSYLSIFNGLKVSVWPSAFKFFFYRHSLHILYFWSGKFAGRNLPVKVFPKISQCRHVYKERRISNRPRNGYVSAGDIKLVSIGSFKQLEVANKVSYGTN